MGVTLGLLAAVFFGGGDFIGGRVTRDAPVLRVLVVSQATAAACAVVLALLFGGRASGGDLAYGVVAGMFNVAGLGLLYVGLATGRMGVVAPIAAVMSSAIPVLWGVATGESPAAIVFVGVAVAIVAAAMVSREHDADTRTGSVGQAVVLALFAGALFGTSLVLFTHTGGDSGLWPVLAARASGFVAVGLALLARPDVRRVHPTPSVVRLAVVAGVCDVLATAFIVTAVRNALTVVVAPIVSLAPGFTVLLAWAVLHERLSRVQIAGLLLALVGLALIAAG